MQIFTTLLFITCSLFATINFAQVNWIGGNGNWNVAGNWSSGSIPSSTDRVNINSPDVVTIPSSYSATAEQVAIASGASLITQTNSSLILSNIGVNLGWINNSGTLDNYGTITINGAIWDENTIDNYGTVTNRANATITVNSGPINGIGNRTGGQFHNYSTLNINNGNLSGITNLGGTFNNNDGGAITIDNPSKSGIHVSSGTFNNNTGGTTTISNTGEEGIKMEGGTLNNTGTLTMTNSIGNYGIWTMSSTFNNQSGGIINIDNTPQDGIYHEDVTFTNAGTITMSTGIGANGIYTECGDVTNSGTITINHSTESGIFNGDVTFQNSGTINVNTSIGKDGINAGENSFTNQSGGVITLQNTGANGLLIEGGAFTNAGTIQVHNTTEHGIYNELGSFDNSGTITISNGISKHGILNIGQNKNFQNLESGEITINNTTMDALHISDNFQFKNFGKVIFESGIMGKDINFSLLLGSIYGKFINETTPGRIEGLGSIEGNYFFNNGVISPGFSPGTISIENSSDFTNATYEVELFGTGGLAVPGGHDHLTLFNTVTLGGTLEVTLENSFVPSIGDCFKIIDAPNGYSGTFSNVSLPTIPAGTWDLQYNSNDVTLKIVISECNNGLNFDGTDDRVEFLDVLPGMTDLTIEARIKPETFNATHHMSLVRQFGTQTGRFYLRLMASNGRVEFFVNGNSTSAQSTALVSLNTWTHIAITYSSECGEVKIYINGVLDSTHNITTAYPTNEGGFSLGSYANGSAYVEFFDGTMDEVRIWNVVQETFDLQLRKDCELDGTDDNLVAYYNFNHGNAGLNNAGITTLSDITSGGRDGDLQMFTLNGSESNWVQGLCPNGTCPTFSFACSVGDNSKFDVCFDTDGFFNNSSSNGQAEDVFLQNDGKIVVAVNDYSTQGLGVMRINPDGTADNSFDGDGFAFASFSGVAKAFGVAVQDDGKIVVVGESADDFAVARFNTDGSLDNTFDTDGKVTTNFVGSSEDRGKDVVIQPDGKIVVVGWHDDNVNAIDYAVARYNTDGSLDNTFDSDGKQLIDFDTDSDLAFGVALQSDGKIVISGNAHITGSEIVDFGVTRLNTDGSLDNTFDSDGKVTVDFNSSSDYGRGIIIQDDGKIVVSGQYYDPSNSNQEFAAIRLNTNGSLDNSFDSDGKVSFGIPGGNQAPCYGVALQCDNKIILSGSSFNNSIGEELVIARLNTNGSLDNSFNSDGIITVGNTGGGEHYAVAVQPNGKILGVGSPDVQIIRYSETGIVLPIELISFKAIKQNEKNVLLEWITTSEVNNALFEIEHSQDGSIFKKIGIVNGKGTTNQSSSYNFVHMTPNNGINYYKLKQIDYDGQFEYSKIVNVHISTEAFSIFPNPTNSILNLEFTKEEFIDRIEIYSIDGQVLRKWKYIKESQTINISEFPRGIYLLKANIGNQVFTKKIMKL